jgi:hypothetical protein
MGSPWQHLLTVGPLGVYFGVLAFWQSGRHPRVVRGLVDFGLMAFGLGAVLAFGPFGRLVAAMISRRPEPDPADRLIVVAILGLWGCLLAAKSLNRLVVYHIDPEGFTRALEDVLARCGGRFVRTLGGFEDRAAPRGVRVEITPWFRCAVVEAYGRDAEGLIREVRPRLRRRLAGVPASPSRVALALYAGSALTMLLPAVERLLSRPEALEALRLLLRRWP